MPTFLRTCCRGIWECQDARAPVGSLLRTCLKPGEWTGKTTLRFKTSNRLPSLSTLSFDHVKRQNARKKKGDDSFQAIAIEKTH
jgi:hypothetical protein